MAHSQPHSPIWLRIIAVIGVIWYTFGLLQFYLAVSIDTDSAVNAGTMSAAHASAIASTPVLVWVLFALASGLGLAGSLALFIRSATALPLFIGSLLSAVGYYLWVYGLSGTGAARPSEETVIAIVVVAVTILFTLLARRMARSV